MSSSIITYAETLGEDVVAKIKASLTAFVSTELGTLSVDAVNFINAEMPGSSDSDKRDAAKTKLLNDAGEALKELLADGDAILNYAIENAIQALAAGLVSSAVAAL